MTLLTLDDEALLAQCRLETFRSSGPGGQHRNKVSSGVRLHHEPTRVTAEATERRSQHENRRVALRRLRMHIACRIRRPVDPESKPPGVVAECLSKPRGSGPDATARLTVGRKDRRFWAIAAYALDVLDDCNGKLRDAAARIGITTGNLSGLLTGDRHVLTACQAIRRQYGLKPLSQR